MTIDTGATAWLIAATALVLFMTPGLAFFYGGLVRGRNAVNTIMFSFMAMAVVSVVWVVWGFSLAFKGENAYIGDLSAILLSGIAIDAALGDTIPGLAYPIPTLLFAAFQMMFAIITPALITGAIVERFKFTTYLVFLVLWITLVYAPIAHWVWAPTGWLFAMGALDYAGGTVVHINAGIAALVAAMVLGKRHYPGLEPHNVPFVVLGAGILWFGWFGFNGGSALAADGRAVSALLVTNTAAAAGALMWGILSQVFNGKMSAVGVATGAVAGLVAITPASGFVDTTGAIMIGLGAGIFCYLAVLYRPKTGLDDSLDVFAVHGVGGIWGALATGIFAVSAVGGPAASGLLDGNPAQLYIQFVAVAATLVYSGVVTFVILKVLDVIPGLGIRASQSEEGLGLDITAHGERAYVQDGAD